MRTCRICDEPAAFMSSLCAKHEIITKRSDKKRKGKKAMRSIFRRYCVLHPTNKIHFNF